MLDSAVSLGLDCLAAFALYAAFLRWDLFCAGICGTVARLKWRKAITVSYLRVVFELFASLILFGAGALLFDWRKPWEGVFGATEVIGWGFFVSTVILGAGFIARSNYIQVSSLRPYMPERSLNILDFQWSPPTWPFGFGRSILDHKPSSFDLGAAVGRIFDR